MTDELNPVATHQLPMFVTPPGHTDVLMVVTAVILGLSVVGFGVLFLRLHTLPERVAHKAHKIQFEIVAILGLLALFTHMHIFWVAGLLLAFIDLPDFGGFLGRIAGSVERMAGVKPGSGADDVPDTGRPAAAPPLVTDIAPDPVATKKPVRAVGSRKEPDHA
jgi:hypothetical protein